MLQPISRRRALLRAVGFGVGVSVPVFVLAYLVCLWVWRRHGLATRALWAFVTLMSAWVLQVGAKALVQRARPVVDDALEHAPGSSFPSGHATNTAAAALTLTLLV